MLSAMTSQEIGGEFGLFPENPVVYCVLRVTDHAGNVVVSVSNGVRIIETCDDSFLCVPHLPVRMDMIFSW